MTPEDRWRLRTALRINERLIGEFKPSLSPLLPLDTWRELIAAARGVVLANERGWAPPKASSASARSIPTTPPTRQIDRLPAGNRPCHLLLRGFHLYPSGDKDPAALAALGAMGGCSPPD